MAKKKSKQGVRPPINGVVLPQPGRKTVQFRNVGLRSVVDPIALDVTSSANPYSVSTGSGGAVNGNFTLSPLGVSGVTPAGASSSVMPAHLPWLHSTAINFLEFRVTRAVLNVVGNVGSTATGTVVLASSPDYIDSAVPASAVGTLVVGGTSFPLADLATSNRKIPLRISSVWKNVSAVSSVVIGGTVVSNSTVDDLMFTGFQYSVFGGPNSTSVMSFFLEYDVEFRGVSIAGFND